MSRRKRITFGTLPVNPRHNVALRCQWCMVNVSACRSDYFMCDPNDVPECSECNAPLELMREIVKYRRETPESAEKPLSEVA